MREKTVLTLIFLTVLLLPIGSAKAWVQNEPFSSGSWEYADHDKWKSPYNGNYSWFEYRDVDSNFSRWSFVVRLTDYDIGGLWMIERCQQIFNASLNNGEPYWDHRVQVIVGHQISLVFLGLKSVSTWVKVLYDDEQIAFMSLNRILDVEVHLWKNPSNLLNIAFLMKYQGSSQCVYHTEVNKTVGSTWFDALNRRQRVEKQLYSWGFVQGMIQGEKLGETVWLGDPVERPYSVEPTTLAEQIGFQIWESLRGISYTLYCAMPQNVRGFIDQANNAIVGFGSLAYSLFTALGVTLISNLPLFIGAYGLYLILLIFRCLDKGSFNPLFDHFFKIADLFLSIGNVILSVIRTIINLIKWW